MNWLSTDPLTLPVLGLDVAKNSVQAGLRITGNTERFGFANNPKGLAQLARILIVHQRQRFGQAWKPPVLTAMPWHYGCMGAGIA